jgi:endonuclease/exonuclease/phosphatase family metal-dependent hydrolase
MNRIIINIFCLLTTFGINIKSYSQINKIITYNIKYDNPNDSLNNWDNRKMELVSLLKYYEPDLFGVQEALEHQLNYIDLNLVNYSRIGVGRDDGKQKGEFSPIYYDSNKFSLIDESTFWLSDQDDTVSIGWDASMERICTYGVFENKTSQKKIFVLNTHFDHIGEIAREESSKLILSKINDLNKNNYPVILMGDFNAEPETKPIRIFKKELIDGAELSKDGIYGPYGTYTGFTKDVLAKRRLDYIFVKNLKVEKYRHIDDKMKNSNYLSDHLPVLIEFK